jgi:hypothetical protein
MTTVNQRCTVQHGTCLVVITYFRQCTVREIQNFTKISADVGPRLASPQSFEGTESRLRFQKRIFLKSVSLESRTVVFSDEWFTEAAQWSEAQVRDHPGRYIGITRLTRG